MAKQGKLARRVAELEATVADLGSRMAEWDATVSREAVEEDEALKAAAVSRETAPAKKASAGARRQEG